MDKLTALAEITANPDTTDLVKAELLKFINITRAEAVCIKR